MSPLKRIFLQIFTTKIGWLGITLAGAVIFGILANYYDWCEYAMYVCFTYPLVLTLIGIVYGGIINPLRDRKERLQRQKDYKDQNPS